MEYQKQELSPFAKVKYESLKAAYPHLPEEEIKEIARDAGEAAKRQLVARDLDSVVRDIAQPSAAIHPDHVTGDAPQQMQSASSRSARSRTRPRLPCWARRRRKSGCAFSP